MEKEIVFLPGAGGDPDFWKPLGRLLPAEWKKTYIGWPGLGHQKKNPDIRNVSDFMAMVLHQIQNPPVDLIAQSMGGNIGIQLLQKYPEMFGRVVFTATGGGLCLSEFGGEDWRPAYLRAFPDADLSLLGGCVLSLADISAVDHSVLVFCADQDPICPEAAGKQLVKLLAKGRLKTVRGSDHGFAAATPHEIVKDVISHLGGICDL